MGLHENEPKSAAQTRADPEPVADPKRRRLSEGLLLNCVAFRYGGIGVIWQYLPKINRYWTTPVLAHRKRSMYGNLNETNQKRADTGFKVMWGTVKVEEVVELVEANCDRTKVNTVEYSQRVSTAVMLAGE
ncbi:hypothetical protein B0H13DRAFT_1872349 [Mycena leptocephala]|nr:hypothetical protein B0H13DRAFT_1872349 [Mycena leptocephala]